MILILCNIINIINGNINMYVCNVMCDIIIVNVYYYCIDIIIIININDYDNGMM